MSDKEQFARDRMREDDFALELEYSEREYILREKTRTGPLIDTDPGDEQPDINPRKAHKTQDNANRTFKQAIR